MKTKKQKAKKAIIAVLCCAVCICVGFSCISWFVYDRSIMSSLAEMYMIMVDRDCIYEQGAEYVHNLRVRAKENLEDYDPRSV